MTSLIGFSFGQDMGNRFWSTECWEESCEMGTKLAWGGDHECEETGGGGVEMMWNYLAQQQLGLIVDNGRKRFEQFNARARESLWWAYLRIGYLNHFLECRQIWHLWHVHSTSHLGSHGVLKYQSSLSKFDKAIWSQRLILFKAPLLYLLECHSRNNIPISSMLPARQEYW